MALTVLQMQALLNDFTYKPGWSFEVYEGAWEGPHMVIRARLLNSYRPDEMVDLDINSPMPPFRDSMDFFRWLAWRLGRIEVHEMREFFKVNGKVLFDPHAEYADRDLV